LPLPIGVGGADLFELRRLVAVGDAAVAQAPGLAALLQGGVVQVAVVGQQPHRTALLRARRVGTQLVGPFHGRPFSGRVDCSAMYRPIVASDTCPTEVARYDLDHRGGSRERRCGNSPRSTREVKPLHWWATSAGEVSGPVRTNSRTWSGRISNA